MKKLIFSLFVCLLSSVSSIAQPDFRFYFYDTASNYYLLPGERFDGILHVSNNGPFSGSAANGKMWGIKTTSTGWDINGFFSQTNLRVCDYYWSDDSDKVSYFINDSTPIWDIMALAKTSSYYMTRCMLVYFSGIRLNDIADNKVGYVVMDAAISSGEQFPGQGEEISRGFTFRKLDGIRGDINGDGLVTSADLVSYIGFIGHGVLGNRERYVQSGKNYGKMILPGQSMPTKVVGPTLLNVWLNNPIDPAVKDLGFGKPMSETVGNVSLFKRASSARYTSEIVGDKLTIKTSSNAAINVFSFQRGKLWQKDSFADANGQWTVEIPDPAAKYTVEICELGGPINPTAISKPVLKSAPIRKYSAQNAAFDIRGRKITGANYATSGLRIIQMSDGATKTTIFNRHR
ncbi:MAG: hypothetical protein PHE24_02165 [Patescibacteria group bacterium]|nr:hypothetical protein [Patescibacteria group bacterium]